jgi:predicted ATP-dependent protease
LTGEQGAIIPQANVATLMLDEKVLQAVRDGQFHIYAVRQADEALSLLVGEPAGEPDEEGQFPEGTVNARVVERLRAIAEMISEDDLKEAEKELAQQALAQTQPT